MKNLNKTILVVDDEASICEMLNMALKKWNYKPIIAKNLKEGISAVERGKIDLVLTDMKLPDGTGAELLERVRSLPEHPPVLLMTAFGSTDGAVQAMRLGAFYYIVKPFKLEELKLLLDRALVDEALKNENEELKQELKKDYTHQRILGSSKSIKNLLNLIERVSKTKTNILVTGESGTGKELVARAIHYSGVLKNKPFVAVNCGAIPENLIESELFGHKKGSFTGAVVDKEGLFQAANGGTIFLDEIGELPQTMQVKLLRVLQDRTFRAVGGTDNIKVDVRVISATNKNLEAAIQKGSFREDLYYRLNVINIRTPSLRERKEDIEILVNHFLRKYSLGMGKSIQGITPEALKIIMNYNFPGNVRELENTIERAVALEGAAYIDVESLPLSLQNFKSEEFQKNSKEQDAELDVKTQQKVEENVWTDPKDALEHGAVNLEEIVGSIEKTYIIKALEKTNGMKKKAADLLGITFRSLRYRIAKYGIDDVEGEVEEV